MMPLRSMWRVPGSVAGAKEEGVVTVFESPCEALVMLAAAQWAHDTFSALARLAGASEVVLAAARIMLKGRCRRRCMSSPT